MTLPELRLLGTVQWDWTGFWKGTAKIDKKLMMCKETERGNVQGSRSIKRERQLSDCQYERVRLIVMGCILLEKLQNIRGELRQCI